MQPRPLIPGRPVQSSWWLCYLVPTASGSVELKLGKWLSLEGISCVSWGRDLLPHEIRPCDFPLEYKCYFPAVYLLIETNEPNDQPPPDRHASFVQLYVDSMNLLLNWNQSTKQRQNLLKKNGFAILEESEGLDSIAFSAATSPMLALLESASKVTERCRSGIGFRQGVMGSVLRRERQERQGYQIEEHQELSQDAPHDRRTTTIKLAPSPLPINHLSRLAQEQRLNGDGEWKVRCELGITPEDGLLDRPQGMSRDEKVPDTFGMPMSCR